MHKKYARTMSSKKLYAFRQRKFSVNKHINIFKVIIISSKLYKLKYIKFTSFSANDI